MNEEMKLDCQGCGGEGHFECCGDMTICPNCGGSGVEPGQVPPAVGEYAVKQLADLRARLAKYEDDQGNPAANQTMVVQRHELLCLEADNGYEKGDRIIGDSQHIPLINKYTGHRVTIVDWSKWQRVVSVIEREDAEGRSLQPSMADALTEVGAFLLGEGELDGYGFLEPRPDKPGRFWWRKELRTALESQAREIERLRMQLVACGVVALANTPDSAAKARDMHPDYMSASCGDVMRAVDSEMHLRAELAALKAQPSGVVLPERKPANFHWNECIEEVKRLNASPVSAGGLPGAIDQLAAIERSIDQRDARLAAMAESAGGVNERAAFEAWFRDKYDMPSCVPFNWSAESSRLLLEGWQARSALSAPSHGEQVRACYRTVKVGAEGVQFGNAWFSHESITGYTAEQLNGGDCRVTGRAYMDWLAAAPSAGSQGGDV